MSKSGSSAIDVLNQLKPDPQIDESFYDAHAGFLMSVKLPNKGDVGIVSFLTMCRHLGQIYDLSGKISDIDQQTIGLFKLFLEQFIWLKKDLVAKEMETLGNFLSWAKREGFTIQDLVIMMDEARN